MMCWNGCDRFGAELEMKRRGLSFGWLDSGFSFISKAVLEVLSGDEMSVSLPMI